VQVTLKIHTTGGVSRPIQTSEHDIGDAAELRAVIDDQTQAIKGTSDLDVHIGTDIANVPELLAMLTSMYPVGPPARIYVN
jgi:hypothetical protein